MKLQTLAILVTALAGAGIASAANYSWLGSGAAGDWTDGGNWFNLDTSTFGVAPAAGDLAIIGYVSADFNSTPRPVVNSVLYNAPGVSTGPLGFLGMDWWDEVSAAPENPELTIGIGGGFEVSNTYMNFGGQETATINITGGGYLRSWTQLQMAMTAGGTSQINIDSGMLYTPSLIFGPGNSNIDLEPGGILYLGGDQSANVATWIDTGKITGGNNTLDVQYDFGVTLAGLTAVYAVVPEPTTITMALLGLAAVLRRNRR